MSGNDHIFDDLFHGAALRAFLEQAQLQQDWPCPEATRLLAYGYYEHALAARNAERARTATIPCGTTPLLAGCHKSVT